MMQKVDRVLVPVQPMQKMRKSPQNQNGKKKNKKRNRRVRARNGNSKLDNINQIIKTFPRMPRYRPSASEKLVVASKTFQKTIGPNYHSTTEGSREF